MKRLSKIDKKQRKHDMFITFLSHASAGKKRSKSSAPLNIRSMILLLLGTV